MSVEQRLRDGFADAVAAYLPDAEPALVEVRRRRRDRRTGLAAGGAAGLVAALVAAVALLTGPQDNTPQPVAPDDPAVSVPAASTDVRGTWSREVTTAQAQALGASRSFIERNIGADGRLLTTLTFGLSRYVQEGEYPRGTSVGDRGTYSYDARGRLVLVSESPGVAGWTARLSWRVDGDTLVLEEAPGTRLSPGERAMILGTWNAE